MDLNEFNTFCAALPATSSVIRWGGSHVWKVGGKVFAIGTRDAGGAVFVTFKVSPLAFDILKDQPGCIPAPYLASRGMSWIQRRTDEAVDDDALRDYLAESHRLVAAKLTRKARTELGLAAS